MSEWLPLAAADIASPKQEKFGEVEITTFASTADVPTAIKGDYDPVQHMFMLQFRYPGGTEPTREVTKPGDVQLKVGKLSQRLYAVEVKWNPPPVGTNEVSDLERLLLTSIEEVLGMLVRDPLSSQREGSYLAAKQAFEKKAQFLVQIPSTPEKSFA